MINLKYQRAILNNWQHIVEKLNNSDTEPTKQDYLTAIIYLKHITQTGINNSEGNELKKFLAIMGELFSYMFDKWQELGATYEELLNFCNCKPKLIEQIKQDIEEYENIKFSDLLIIHHIDYIWDNDVVICSEKYAPITHAVIEYHRDLIHRITVKNPEIKEKIDSKISELFSDSAVHIANEVKDSDGNKYLCFDGQAQLTELATPLQEDLLNQIVDDVYSVVIDNNISNSCKVDFVHSLLHNIQYILDIQGVFTPNSKDDIKVLLEYVCPKYLSSNDIYKIMQVCNY